MQPQSHRLAALASVFVVALALRAVVIAVSGFDGLYGQDPFAYFTYAEQLRQALVSVAPPPPFHWPIGYPLLVALATPIFGENAAQWVSAIAGACVAPIIYAIVMELRPQARAGALIAGLLAATAPQLMISSVSVMSDASALAWITLSAWALLRYRTLLAASAAAPGHARAQWMFVVCAASFAMAVLTRWQHLIAAIAWAVSSFLIWHDAGMAPRRRVWSSALAVTIFAVVVGGQFTGDWEHGTVSHSVDFHTVGWNPLLAFRSTVSSSDGTLRYAMPVGVFYAQPLAHPSFVFPLLTVFVVFGAVASARGPLAPLVLLLGWALSMYGYLVARPWENPRFSLGLFPPLLVLVGVGFDSIIESVPARWRKLVIGYAVIGLLGSLAWNIRTVSRFAAVKDSQLAVVRWAAAATPERATIVSFGLTDTLAHYTPRVVANLYELDTDALAALTATPAPTYLLVDPVNLEDQWRGKRPARNFEWLRDHTTLTEVGRQAPWVLYKIESRRT